MHHEAYAVKGEFGELGAHSPEVAACATISPSVRTLCLSLIVKRAALVFEVSL